MADAIISVVAEKVTTLIQEQIRNEINLVRGVEKEVLDLCDELTQVRNLLDDADKQGFNDKRIKDWLKRLEDTTYEMEDVLDEWEMAVLELKMEHESNDAVAAPPKQKVCSFMPSSCLCFKKVVVRRDIAKKIKNVKEQLDKILKEKDRYNFLTSQPIIDKSWRGQSTSFVDSADVHGRDSDSEILLAKLMADGGRQDELGIQVVSVVGVGGLGKTTLAQLVYNNSQVKEHFKLRIWVCVSDPFDEAGIAKRIVEGVNTESSKDTNNLEVLLQSVRDSVGGKKFLLVLDDVWTEDYAKWEPLKTSLKCGGAGSKILVTTRNEKVAKMMGTTENGIHHLGQLSDKDCWLLLCRRALFGRNEKECEKFEDIGKKIANKCRGLPLAAKTLGSLLRFKNSLEEWENVLNNEIWQLEEAEDGLFPHLLLSYNDLPLALKRCFSYCAVFPKDFRIDVHRLIEYWMALGYLGSDIGSGSDKELRGREYFDILAMRSLFQDFEVDDLDGQIKRCKMHDIVHDFAQFLRNDRNNGRVELVGNMKTNCQSCSPSLVSNVKKYRSIIWNDEEAPPNLCGCPTSLRVLRMPHQYLDGVPHEIRPLIHLRWLDLSHNKISREEDTKAICKLYNLQFLRLDSCHLKEIPWEIGNLKYLRHLDLSRNFNLKELPESMCDLHELRTLNIDFCSSISKFPEGIHRLVNLKHIHMDTILQLNEGIAQLSGLRTLTGFYAGSGVGKLRWLKNLNHLSGFLYLKIKLTDHDLEDMVEDAQEAELREKIDIQELWIEFMDEMDEKDESSSVRIDVINALEPRQNLRELRIYFYKGCKLPNWIASPINQLRSISLFRMYHLSSLPSLGKLPFLEELFINGMSELQFVGREFLGMAGIIGGGDNMGVHESSSSSVAAAATNTAIVFPKLKKLKFRDCPKWKEWEDITAEEEGSAALSLMPCLTELSLHYCTALTTLPHHLLRKVPLLEVLNIYGSTQLIQRYWGKDRYAWQSISRNNRRLQLKNE